MWFIIIIAICSKLYFFSSFSEQVEIVFDVRSNGICDMGNKGVCPGGEICCENVKQVIQEPLIEYKCVEANQCMDIP